MDYPTIYLSIDPTNQSSSLSPYRSIIQSIRSSMVSMYVGNVIASSLDAAYLSRHVALKSGVPIKVSVID